MLPMTMAINVKLGDEEAASDTLLGALVVNGAAKMERTSRTLSSCGDATRKAVALKFDLK